MQVIYSDIEKKLMEIGAAHPHCGDYGQLLWHADRKHVWWVGGDADWGLRELQWKFAQLPEVNIVSFSDEYFPIEDLEGNSDQVEGWQWLDYPGGTYYDLDEYEPDDQYKKDQEFEAKLKEIGTIYSYTHWVRTGHDVDYLESMIGE